MIDMSHITGEVLRNIHARELFSEQERHVQVDASDAELLVAETDLDLHIEHVRDRYLWVRK